jgi:hypothetical protein
MELLGFIDLPATSVTAASRGVVMAEASPPPDRDVFEGWAPREVGSELTRRRLAWGRILVVVTLGTLLGWSAYNLAYPQPQVTPEARQAVMAASDDLSSHMPTLSEEDLISATLDAVSVNESLIVLDEDVRSLFEAASALPEGEAKTLLVGAATTAGEARRLYSEAYSYRVTTIPSLAAPQLETDPSVTSAAEAASDFAAWVAGFEQVRQGLPDDLFPEVADGFDGFIAELEDIQTQYLDGLVDGDATAVSAAVVRIDEGLAALEELVVAALAEAQSQVDDLIAGTQSALARAPELLG